MNVYEIVTERIITALERGTAPWRKAWSGGAEGIPRNLASGKPYRGANILLLACSPYASPYWVTYKQAQQLGGSVRKGEKGHPVLFWRWFERDSADGAATGDARRRVPVVRYYTVFNAVDQCDGLDVPRPAAAPPPFAPIEEAERLVRAMPSPPTITHGGDPCYLPTSDIVRLPAPEQFNPPEEYYCTAFHELVHATGHESRLARKGVTDGKRFGDHAYSREELIAETGAAFLCAHAGIEQRTLENSAAYLAHWIQVLRGDSRLVVEAAAAAQRATDWIRGQRPAEEAADTTDTEAEPCSILA